MAAVLAVSMIFSVSCKEKEDTDETSQKESSGDSSVVTTAPDSSAGDSSQTEQPGSDDPETPPSEFTGDPSDITPAMWKIETESGKTIYFMGSMHALPDSAYPLPDEIMDAYNSSDALAVECDIVAYAADFQAQIDLAEQLMYTDGTSIKDHIGEDLYNRLVSKMKDWNIYMSAYDFYKPAMWQSLIDSYLMGLTDLDSDQGFDSYFLNKAKEESKEIIEVESAQFQMDMLVNFSDDIYKLMFESYVQYTAEEYTAELEQLYQAWAEGDMDRIHEMDEVDASQLSAEEMKIYEEYNKQMLLDRNKTMAEKLIELSKGDKNVFFVVGAAHYPGEGGILELLDEAGVKYERVEYAAD